MLHAGSKIAPFSVSKSLRKRRHVHHMPQVKEQRRRLPRRSRHHLSWITLENDIRSYECQVLDVSTDGAKLVADIEAPIGSTFRLSIVPQAIVRQKCEVVWHKGRVIGVKFASWGAKT
jgi:PilZ domain